MKEMNSTSQKKLETGSHFHPLKVKKSTNLKTEFLKQYYLQKGHKRFDRDFTVSWSKKHELHKQNNSTHASPFFKQNSPTNMNSSYTATPRSNNHRGRAGLLDHLGDDRLDRKKDKVYSEEVYELHQQNEEEVYNTLYAKKQNDNDFNRIAQHYHLKNYRSEQSFNPNTSLSKSWNPFVNGIASPQNENLSRFATENENTQTDVGTTTTMVTNPDATRAYFGKPQKPKDKSKVLEHLEEIYFTDVNKEKVSKFKKNPLLTSPYVKAGNSKNSSLSRKASKDEDYHARMLNDDQLLEKFEDPYGRNLLYTKPINANIRNPKNLKLKELEMKAEVLRNIKSIDSSMFKEAPNRSGSERANLKGLQLPHLKQSNTESLLSPKSGFSKIKNRQKNQSLSFKDKDYIKSVYSSKGSQPDLRQTTQEND